VGGLGPLKWYDMKMMRYMVVTLVICSTCLAAVPPETKQIQGQVTRPPLVFVITGESNSGGIGSNAQATPAERKLDDKEAAT
jgi:hypothetical protein